VNAHPREPGRKEEVIAKTEDGDYYTKTLSSYTRNFPMGDYTAEHAAKGIDAPLPELECWPNQFPNYRITITVPEFTSVCPLTGLPDFGTVTIRYTPREKCLELKAFKMYILAYRNLGIFYENAINRILRDVVAACDPIECEVRGDFTPRGGISSIIEAFHKAQ
jgi:7-cyano-7-deazaguanine reductase